MSIEQKSIDVVTVAERHGRARDQLYLWFVGNLHFFTIALGFVGPGLGLSLGWTTVAGALGILSGTAFSALHAAQGPELGLPQMIQSRAQFGHRGVSVVLVGPLLTFIGFNVADAVLMAQGLHGVLGWNEPAVILLTSALGAALAIGGHDWLHRSFRWCFFLCLPLYGLVSISILKGYIPAPHPLAGGFSWSAFLAQLAVSAGYNLRCAPSISDYSRYLPRATSRATVIAAAYLGASASAIWLIVLGAWLATRLGASDSLVALSDAGNLLIQGLGTVLALGSALVLTAVMGRNAYSGMLTVITGIHSLYDRPATPLMRVRAVAALAGIWVVLALLVTAGPIDLVLRVLTLMLHLLVPWTSINLIDYFLLRRGRYAVMELFAPEGIYGSFNPRGLGAYAAGLLATIPFAAVPAVYVGPAARALGGVDLGWLVGLLVSGAAYLWLSRSFDLSGEEPAPGGSAGARAALEADRVR